MVATTLSTKDPILEYLNNRIEIVKLGIEGCEKTELRWKQNPTYDSFSVGYHDGVCNELHQRLSDLLWLQKLIKDRMM